MKSLPRQTQGIIAAGLLSILTVSVFARAQYSGPESAVLRYHLALSRADAAGVKEIVLQDQETNSARSLNERMIALLSSAPEYNVAGVTHNGREASVDVVYFSRRYGTVFVRFTLVKPRDEWQLDAERTLGTAARARN